MATKSILEIIQEKYPEQEPAKVILNVMVKHEGNQRQAAFELGVNPSTLNRYLNYHKVSA